MSSPTADNPLATASIQLCQQEKPLQKFINGQPKTLGVTLIMLGLIQCGFGIPPRMANLSEVTSLGVPWWLAVLLIVSGALTVVCDRDPNKPRVTACLAMNIINAIATGIAIIIYSVDLSMWQHIYQRHDHPLLNYLRLTFGIKIVLFFYAASGMVINIVVSVFCCKGLRYCSPSTNMSVVVVHNPFSDDPTVVSS
ncbi:membrane-spanning 4-domains subfamily A member 15-like [Heptranchias perlo]|uniref:membrane-spanning 4-domains subfamily A member 15-like n=1 Tax=Heptranchias perlo TaxID=212740 RepID=UPI003559F800